MLTQFTGILFLCLASVSVADVPARLFAVSQVKGIINELQDVLMDFKRNMTQELTKIEKAGRDSHKNATSCLEQISSAHNASRKLLNMLVEGEYLGLKTVEGSVENMTLHEISQLWGALGQSGQSQVKLKKEMKEFKETASARLKEAIMDCQKKRNENTMKKSDMKGGNLRNTRWNQADKTLTCLCHDKSLQQIRILCNE